MNTDSDTSRQERQRRNVYQINGMRSPFTKSKGARTGRGDENLRTMKEAQKSQYRVHTKKSTPEK